MYIESTHSYPLHSPTQTASYSELLHCEKDLTSLSLRSTIIYLAYPQNMHLLIHPRMSL